MTAKDYLKDIHTLDITIQQKRRELDDLQEIATTIGSFDYSRDRVQTSPKGEAPFTKVAEKVAELDTEIRRLEDERMNRIDIIHALKDSRYMTVLYKRYAEYKKFDAIAKEMGYYLSSVYRLHNEALELLGGDYDGISEEEGSGKE